MTLHYYGSCVNWDKRDVSRAGGLSDMIDGALEITRRTFLRHVDRAEVEDFERSMGYDTGHERGGLRMADDYAVSYGRSKLHGRRVYFIRHSAIEYVWK